MENTFIRRGMKYKAGLPNSPQRNESYTSQICLTSNLWGSQQRHIERNRMVPILYGSEAPIRRKRFRNWIKVDFIGRLGFIVWIYTILSLETNKFWRERPTKWNQDILTQLDEMNWLVYDSYKFSLG